ncbi:AfsR/SARP family transcriptional regulator, partial [Streptomyces botrytidirepellens]
MDFSLLGPVTVTTGPVEAPVELPLGPAKRRSVLAMLLLRPNSTVSVEQLVAGLWEDEPPAHARTVIQGHVSRLRAALAEGGADAHGVELTTHSSAYLLRLPATLVDTVRFDDLVARADPESAPADAVPMLRQALGLWRGPALTGTVASPPFAAAAHALEERRLTAVEALARAHGALGEYEKAAGVLHPAALGNPLREGLIADLMLVLYRTGRQSDAIAWFHRTREMLADDLGVDPGERLSAAYQEILRAAPVPEPQPEARDPRDSREPRAPRDPRDPRDPRVGGEAATPAVPAAPAAASGPAPELLPRP